MMLPRMERVGTRRKRWGWSTLVPLLACVAVLTMARGEEPVVHGLKPTVDYHPAAFRGITPGRTKLNELTSILGEPAARSDDADSPRWTYRGLGPFRTVDFFAKAGQVVSIIGRLKEPEPVDALVEQLDLGTFVPVEIVEQGAPLGLVFPERGVLFTYVEGEGKDGERSTKEIDRIAIEPLTGEPFWLRARFADPAALESILRDLAAARRFGWEKPEVSIAEATTLARARRFERALAILERLPSESLDPAARLLHAVVLGQLGRTDEAARRFRQIIDRAEDDLVEAEARLRYGELLSRGLDRKMSRAVKLHTAAIELARPLFRDRDLVTRRRARRIVLEAYLALADAIARGPFRDQREVVQEWCTAAAQLVESQPFLRNDPAIAFLLARRTVAAYCLLDDPPALEESLQRLDDAVKRLDRAFDDPLFLDLVHWQEAHVRCLASRAAVKLGKRVLARQQAARADRLIEAVTPPDSKTAQRLLHYDRGCIAFQQGSVMAVFKQDHAAAVEHYRKAITYFESRLPHEAEDELGVHGERFVSMGVSYWEIGRKERAVELTKRGVSLMEKAVAHQLLDPVDLAVPYGNLSTMQQARGETDESESYARKAAALGRDTTRR